jgi:Amino acid permease
MSSDNNTYNRHYSDRAVGPNWKFSARCQLASGATVFCGGNRETNFLRGLSRLSRQYWYLRGQFWLIQGFELTPSYVEEVRPGVFPKILRNLWLMSSIQLTLMMLLVWALVPYDEIRLHSANILSILAEYAAGSRWLRYWLVVDAVLVLCAGIIFQK